MRSGWRPRYRSNAPVPTTSGKTSRWLRPKRRWRRVAEREPGRCPRGLCSRTSWPHFLSLSPAPCRAEPIARDGDEVTVTAALEGLHEVDERTAKQPLRRLSRRVAALESFGGSAVL